MAFMPELVENYIEKECSVETEGRKTRGMLLINWWHELEKNPRQKIVTEVKNNEVVQVLLEAVLEDVKLH